jgi:uroporphyrinogen-III decarboxylase
MNHRQRALAAMRGQAVDHIPFIGRMELWYGYHAKRGTLPHPYEKASLWELQRDLGIGIFGFGAWSVTHYRLSYPGVDVRQRVMGDGETVIEYATPYGTLTCRDSMSEELREAAGTGARTEYPFKSPQDFDALQYVFEHARVDENFEAYGKSIQGIGDDGLAVPSYGHLPAHQLMIFWMGYEAFYYQLHDHPARVEALLAALDAQAERIIALAAECPADVIQVGGNYDEQMTPPPVFERFFAPWYRRTRALFEAKGKILVVHGDGEMRKLREKLMACGVQVVEAVSPKPMTSLDVAETRRLWDGRVAMWGGLPSVMLTETFSEEQFEACLEDLFRAVAPGERFILGFGDNVPTDALFGRIQRTAEFWRQRGAYPLS